MRSFSYTSSISEAFFLCHRNCGRRGAIELTIGLESSVLDAGVDCDLREDVESLPSSIEFRRDPSREEMERKETRELRRSPAADFWVSIAAGGFLLNRFVGFSAFFSGHFGDRQISEVSSTTDESTINDLGELISTGSRFGDMSGGWNCSGDRTGGEVAD